MAEGAFKTPLVQGFVSVYLVLREACLSFVTYNRGQNLLIKFIDTYNFGVIRIN